MWRRQVTNFSSAMSLDRLKRWHPTGRGFVSHVTPLASGGPPEPFFSRLQNRGVRIWQGVEIFPQHAVFIAQYAAFIAQQMLDQILKICKSFLKIGFF